VQALSGVLQLLLRWNRHGGAAHQVGAPSLYLPIHATSVMDSGEWDGWEEVNFTCAKEVKGTKGELSTVYLHLDTETPCICGDVLPFVSDVPGGCGR
jgi:hypothetical protein